MTAATNFFQGRSNAAPAEQQQAAVSEFDALVDVLGAAGVGVVVVDDTPDPHTPDSIFPNNWVSFHADGRVVLYPMEVSNRRAERRRDIIEKLTEDFGFRVTEVLDLSAHEKSGHYLEGTGSLVLDRSNRIAYACLSSRTHLDPLGDFAQRMGYEGVAFEAVDRAGVPIYHTNVMMSIGETLAIICDAAISRQEQRESVVARLQDTGHEIVRISYDQLQAFAGNVLQLRRKDGGRVFALSTQAWESLRPEQRQTLQRYGKVIRASIANIEHLAGGSVRCMLAEIHLPTL